MKPDSWPQLPNTKATKSFENSYQPQAGSVVLSAEKVLTGRTLQANEFDFELVNEDGTILQTKANDATGKIYFDALAYDEAGEYHYTIREKKGTDGTITYDTKELAVVVTVTDKPDSWPQWRNTKAIKSLKTATSHKLAVSY